MTDNEKRAHDIAIVLLNRLMDMEQENQYNQQSAQGQSNGICAWLETAAGTGSRDMLIKR